MTAPNTQRIRENSHRRIPPDILELITHTNPAPASGPYTSLLRCNGETDLAVVKEPALFLFGSDSGSLLPEFEWPGTAGSSVESPAANKWEQALPVSDYFSYLFPSRRPHSLWC